MRAGEGVCRAGRCRRPAGEGSHLFRCLHPTLLLAFVLCRNAERSDPGIVP